MRPIKENMGISSFSENTASENILHFSQAEPSSTKCYNNGTFPTRMCQAGSVMITIGLFIKTSTVEVKKKHVIGSYSQNKYNLLTQ